MSKANATAEAGSTIGGAQMAAFDSVAAPDVGALSPEESGESGDSAVVSGVQAVEWQSGAEVGTPLPPFAKGLPVLGSALELLRDCRPFLLDNYRKLGPVYRIRAFHKVMTVLAGPSANQFYAQAGTEHLRSRELWKDFAIELGSDNLINAIDGVSHAWQRKVMKPGFARETLVQRLPEAANIVEIAARRLVPGTEFAVLPFMQEVVTEQLGLVMTGRAPGPYVDDIRRMIRTALNVLVVRKWPRLLLLLPGYRRARRRVRELAELVIAEHQATLPPERPRDMVDDLLAAHAERPTEYTARDLRVGVVGPYVAGLDTVANTCTFALHALLENPSALQRVRSEVDAALADGPLTTDKLKTMPALRGAVMETLRLYPVAALSQRTVTTPFTFHGYRVEAGTSLLIATGMTHVLPELFPDPTRFDIDRYEAPRNEHRTRGAYAPYGLGAHVCLGAGLAGIQIALIVAHLLHTTEFELSAGSRPQLRQDPTLTFGPNFRIKVRGHAAPLLNAR